MRRLSLTELAVITGLAVGGFGVLLVLAGNPENTGICVSCFFTNLAGSLRLHSEVRMSYPRPELMGFLLGSFLISSLGGGFRARGSRSSLLVLVVAGTIMVGCEVFIGCPIKMILRFSAGDLTALPGLVGLIAGVGLGVGFLSRGFEIAHRPAPVPAVGYFLPMAALLLTAGVYFGTSLLIIGDTGPASVRAPLAVSLGAGLMIGALAQRSRLCVTGAFRNLFVGREWTLMIGLIVMVGTAVTASIGFGTFHIGYFDQPGVHPDGLWNFLGMLIVGLGSMYIGGCPFRQVILAGEGDNGAGMAVVGMVIAGGLCRSLGISSTAAGPTYPGKIALLGSLVFLLLLGLSKTGRE